jgi:diguanylate cyclase (GGDEF)-like protein/PAS domain S-box-containing protein
MRRLALAVIFAVAFVAFARAAQDTPPVASFGRGDDVIELQNLLKPYAPPAGAKQDATSWYIFTAANLSERPVTRVLRAGQPPDIGLGLIPLAHRPTILQVASTSPGVVIESSNAYGRHGFRITLPAGTVAPLAVRLESAPSPPSLLAWSEPALAAHNRQIAIFVAAVAGLIFAAAAITGGIAVITHHVAPRWAAVALFLMVLTRLAAVGMFDGSLVTGIGGPYGLTAMLAGLTLASGTRFVDLVVPLHELWPWADRWLRGTVIGLVVLSFAAYVGFPATALLTDIMLVGGPVAITAYLVHRGRLGSQPARILTPSAGLFVLLALAVTFAAAGGFGTTSLAPDLAGGFAAAGAILLALAVAAGEGIAVLPFARHAHPPAPPPLRPAPPPPPPPRPHTDEPASRKAMEAICASRQGVFELDLLRDMVALSADAAALLGLESLRMAHPQWTARIHGDDRPVYEQAIAEFRTQSGLAFRIEFRVRAEDGRYPWCELRATMKGPQGAAAERCVGLLADVTTRKEADAEMMDRTLHDPLTGLGNRVALMEELEQLGDKLREAAFAVLDIDRFKAIHASLGDAGGDEFLVRVAQRLSKHYNGFARVFRIGGDAFAVLMRSLSGDPAEVGADLAKLCGAAYQFDGRSVFASVSVGIAVGREARDPIDLLKNAELALAQAKRHGGDCVRTYAQDLDARAPKDSVALESDLHRALEHGEIEVFYQPIVRLADRTVAGFEALLRWRHPTKGLVAPVDFIAHSEETGLIVSLGRLALQRAAKDLSQWQRYYPLPEPLFVSVNLSRRQLRDPELLDLLSGILSGGDLAPGTLKLEITESAIAGDADAQALATKMRALGAGLSIDDFGTGMSSLSQLADLPFDTVKIDKSFLGRHGGTDSETDGEVVLASMIALAHDLKRNVIVEGVETEADAARLAELGCEFAQGFLFKEPMAMQDTLGYIARRFRAAARQKDSGATGVG